MRVRAITMVVVVLLTNAAAARDNSAAPDAAYQQSYEQWKAATIDDLRQNWLPLVGLFWLMPGENTFGTDPANRIVFPKGPAHAGVFFLQAGDVTVRLSDETHATIEGKSVTSAALQPDNPGKPTVVEMGSLRFHVIRRGQRLGIRLKDLDSDAIRRFPGMTLFPVDLSYRVTATWLPSDGKQTIDVPNVLGDVNHNVVPGTAVFKIHGQEYRLTALSGDPSRKLFFVFSDLTAKVDTYPGGRFLDTGPVAGGTVLLDFNRAYNPPCAVTPYATCPLAPKENRLSIAIPVGEKYDHAHGHH